MEIDRHKAFPFFPVLSNAVELVIAAVAFNVAFSRRNMSTSMTIAVQKIAVSENPARCK